MERTLKRPFDVILAILGLVLVAPIMAAIAIALYLESPGHVIYSQTRLGRGGTLFRIHKFRKFPASCKDVGPGVTVSCDARMTWLGAVLERLKLDELPQLWNVLMGEMSIVGPRPESTRFADLFQGKYKKLLEYIPGIFGPSQIAFRNESMLYPSDEDPEAFYRRVLFPSKAEADLDYFGHSSFLKDIGWIVRGLWVSFAGVVDWRRFLGLHSKIVSIDLVMIALAWTIAFTVQSHGFPEGASFQHYMHGLWVLPGILVTGMFLGSCYLHPVRYFSLPDAIRLTAVVSLMLCLGSILLIEWDRDLSLYVILTTWLVLMPLLMAPRILHRLKWERQYHLSLAREERLLIYGAGRGGMALANWLCNGNLVGFVDDDPELLGRRIYGYRVLGRESDIPTLHAMKEFEEIWVTFRLDDHKRKRLQEACQRLGVKLFVILDQEPFARLISASEATPCDIVREQHPLPSIRTSEPSLWWDH